QGHHGALRIAYEDIPQRRKISAISGLGLQIDLPSPAKQIEIVYEVSPERRLQRGEDVVDAEPERLGLLAVYIEINRGRTAAIARKYAGQARILIGGAGQALHDASHGCRLRASDILELVFKAARRGQPHDRRQIERQDVSSANLLRGGSRQV